MSDTPDTDVEPLTIRFHPGKLSDLAAVSFTAALLRFKITYVCQNGKEEVDIEPLNLVQVSLPSALRKKIDDLSYPMEKCWISWWYYHQKYVFLNLKTPDNMIDWVDGIIWSPDGTINYEQTAEKLMIDDRLTQVQKFQLACSYCFMDDVERLKAELTREEIEYASLGRNQDDDGFLNYWYGRMEYFSSFDENERGLLDKIFYSLFDVKDMSNLELYDEWSIIEYCFDQSINEDRLNKLTAIIKYCKPRVTLNILVKSTDLEFDYLIRRRAFSIMHALVEKQDYYEYTILIWKRMVHVISDAGSADIICHVHDLRCDRIYVNTLLWEMWLCASESQKNYITYWKVTIFSGLKSDNMNDYISGERYLLSIRYDFSPPNLLLILDFLSRCDPECRYNYWSKTWTYLIISLLDLRNHSNFHRIMKLCIVDDQKIEHFKMKKMIKYGQISDLCVWVSGKGRIEEMQNYLKFFTSDSHMIRDWMRKLIQKRKLTSDIFQFWVEKWGWDDEQKRNFNLLVDDIFTEDESKEYFNKMITDPGSLDTMREEFAYHPERIKQVIDTIEKFASSEDILIKVKQEIFARFRFEERIENSIYLELMAWCFNADKSVVDKLKESLPPICISPASSILLRDKYKSDEDSSDGKSEEGENDGSNEDASDGKSEEGESDGSNEDTSEGSDEDTSDEELNKETRYYDIFVKPYIKRS